MNKRPRATGKKLAPSVAQLRAARITATFEPVVVVSPTVKDLLARVTRGKRIRHADLASMLAVIGAFYGRRRVPSDFQSAANVPVPIEILTIVGEELVGRSQWAAAQNAARAALARGRRAQWQRKADEVWQRNPRLSAERVAEVIAPGQVSTVRRLITKPRK